MKCTPLFAHISFAKTLPQVATEEEIDDQALAIAADVALNSSMLYGTQFDMDEFEAWERCSSRALSQGAYGAPSVDFLGNPLGQLISTAWILRSQGR